MNRRRYDHPARIYRRDFRRRTVSHVIKVGKYFWAFATTVFWKEPAKVNATKR